jgi:putative oxidoreductase
MESKTKMYLNWALQLTIAIIYLQTLYFKFSAHPDSVYLFTKLGLEPYGRIGIGVFELITSVLILLPRTKIYGAILSLGVIAGALFAHLGPLGIEVNGDKGKVFYLAMVVFVGTILFLLLNWRAVTQQYKSLKGAVLRTA